MARDVAQPAWILSNAIVARSIRSSQPASRGRRRFGVRRAWILASDHFIGNPVTLSCEAKTTSQARSASPRLRAFLMPHRVGRLDFRQQLDQADRLGVNTKVVSRRPRMDDVQMRKLEIIERDTH